MFYSLLVAIDYGMWPVIGLFRATGLEVSVMFTERRYCLIEFSWGMHILCIVSYLSKQEEQAECVGCACPLTVQHIMIDSVVFSHTVDFSHIQSHFFDVESMKELFNSVRHPEIYYLYVRVIELSTRCNLELHLSSYCRFYLSPHFSLCLPVVAMYDLFSVDVPLNIDILLQAS